jgi:hypothetical protein
MYIIVTKNKALVEVLREDYGITGEVFEEVTADDVTNEHVVGNIPLHLISEAEKVSHLQLETPPGVEEDTLTPEQIRMFARGLITTQTTVMNWIPPRHIDAFYKAERSVLEASCDKERLDRAREMLASTEKFKSVNPERFERIKNSLKALEEAYQSCGLPKLDSSYARSSLDMFDLGCLESLGEILEHKYKDQSSDMDPWV